MENRRSSGMSPAGSYSSLNMVGVTRTGSPVPRGESPGPSGRPAPRGESPGPTARRRSSGDLLKGGGIQVTIQNLAHEQERVQKKTFTNWINVYLAQRMPPMKVNELFVDIRDGVVLLSLLEVLSGTRLPMERGSKLRRVHYVSNISTAIQFLQSKKIKLVNINAADIADGKPSIVLGLVWTIILYFQIEETTTRLAAQEVETGAGGPPAKKQLTAMEKFRMGAKKALLQWTENAVTKRYGIQVKNFGTSWRDGLAFNAMIHNIRPDLIDMENVQKQSSRVNLEGAFSTAETQLGIPRLIDPEDVDVDKPDEKSIMTYVAQFLKAYPEAGDDPANSSRRKGVTTGEAEMQDYNDLMAYLDYAVELLQIVEQPITDQQQEYMDYVAFKIELDRKEPTYKKLGDKIRLRKAMRLTETAWKKLQDRWTIVQAMTQKWLWKLDSSLPSRLGQLGDWLFRAELILDEEADRKEHEQEMADQLSDILLGHKEFFHELDPYKVFFRQVKQAGRIDGQFVPGPQMENLSSRLQAVSSRAPLRQRKLEYQELKHRLLAFLVVAEAKLRFWSIKYGEEEDVVALLEDYKDFVQTQQLYENFDLTYADVKKRAEAYKKDDPVEVEQVDQYLDHVKARWKKLCVEIGSIQTMLEKVIENWQRYGACVDLLTVGLAEGEEAMTGGTEEEKKEFLLKELPQYDSRHKVLNESGNFLIEVSSEPVATEIKQTLLLLNRRFKDLTEQYQNFQQFEIVGKATQQYGDGVSRVGDWLKRADALMVKKVPCVHAPLKEHLQQLDSFSNQVAQIETDFKLTTKTAQSLVKDCSQEDVNAMLQTLNVQKEVIVRLRKEIPERMKYLRAILPNIESLETGFSDLNLWLDAGEELLKSHRLDGQPDVTETRLEKHKTFFAETTYQKSIVESKNRVFQKIKPTRAKLKNVDFADLDDTVLNVNQRFLKCISSAKNWESELEKLSRQWRTFGQKGQALNDWLDQADAVLSDNTDDIDSLLRKHKSYFEHTDSSLLSEYQKCADEILKTLEPGDREYIQRNTDALLAKWEHIKYHAPMRLIKLEFRIQEDKFLSNVEFAEDALSKEQQQLSRREEVQEVLQKHRQVFQQSNFFPTCQKCLESMNALGQRLLQHNQEDATLDDQYEEHADRWRRLEAAIDNLHLQLKQLPERWKTYNQKVDEFSGWVDEVEGLLTHLQKEDLTNEEYKEALGKFQKAMRDIGKFSDDSRSLIDNLDELLKDAPDSDASTERQRLEALLARFKELQPNMGQASNQSSVFAKCYDFRDNIRRRSNWLDDTYKLVQEQPFIDGLDDAKSLLHDHESVMMKLDSEKPNIVADLEAGKRLQQDKDVPSFVMDTVDELDQKWKDTTELAEVKHGKLKQKVTDWDKYETDRTQITQYLKKAETELEKAPVASGQDLAQKDLAAKKELQFTLGKLQSNLADMQKLNELLCEGASRERKGPLKGEITDIDKRLGGVSIRLNAKLSDLEATIAKWSEYYKRLNNFCDWLYVKETDLNEVYENTQDLPDQQLSKAKDISVGVYENHVTLEALEKDARGLTQNFRSRETAALKSKLTSVRRQWESLCTRAKDRSAALTGSVAHWQKYQTLSQQLIPWIVKAEKYCATTLPKCASIEEARDLYEIQQGFVKECEQNFPTFEKMNSEAGYLMDQPNMAREVESIQRRWTDILATCEDRNRKVNKSHGAWMAYDAEISNCEEIVAKLENRVAAEPNVTSADVQVLEHEVALCKTLQDEIRSNQPQLNALQRQFEQVRQHASPEGIEALKSKQDTIKAAWETVNASAVERLGTLNAALQHRRGFFANLQDFEKWVKRMQRKLDTDSEIYTDDVGDQQRKLKVMASECQRQEAPYAALTQKFKELMETCGPDEAAILSDRFGRLADAYSKVEDRIDSRDVLFSNWEKYHGDHKDTQARLQQLQAKLSSPDLTEEEVNAINEEIMKLKADMTKWDGQINELDDRMLASLLVIKDRATQRTFHFGAELQTITTLCDTVSVKAKQKEDRLGEMSQMYDDFSNKRNKLVDRIKEIEEKVTAAEPSQSSLKGINDLVKEIEEMREELYTHNPEYEQLRDLGRQIMQADSGKAADVQSTLNKVNEAWENVQAVLAKKQQYYSGVSTLWQQYNDSKQGVTRSLDEVAPSVEQDLTFLNQAEVKKSLDHHKNAEFDLHACQPQLDQMNNKGVQLMEELKNVPNFDVGVMEQDLDEVNVKWENSNKAIGEHRENLEAQLVCWDHVQTGTEEVQSWVTTMVGKLEDSLRHFDDAVSVESKLIKYREEAPYFEEVLSDIEQKIKDLQELNRDNEIPPLLEAQTEIQEGFDRATTLAAQLETVMANFSDEREDLQRSIEEETEWLNQIKDVLAACDDVSGTDEDLVERLGASKDLQDELASHKNKMLGLQEKTATLQTKYPSAETASLAKDALVLNRKYESLLSRGDKIQDVLQSSLEQHCVDAQQQHVRWLNTAKEKLAWCEDATGDRYSVEAKLATIRDLTASIVDGEEKMEIAVTKVAVLGSALPPSKKSELQQQADVGDRDWRSLILQLQATESKLTSSIDQWQSYDDKYDNLSQWLKDTEGKMRSQGALKADVAGKQDQHETFKELENDIQSHRGDIENLVDKAQDISRSTGDGRTASYAGQLLSRFQNLSVSVKEQVDRSEQNIDAHETFLKRHKACVDWIEAAQQQMTDGSDEASDEEALNTRLNTVKALLANKDQGLATFNSALESGEKLYPNTAHEGRERIRQDLRGLRDMWESYNDSLNESQRQLENSRMKWSSFDENYEQFVKWVVDMERQLSSDVELKNTVQEKRALLQHYRTRCQDIMSHQTMLDSINDKGSALSSTQIRTRLTQLNASYKELCTSAQSRVKKSEGFVDQNQRYQDQYQQCRDWLSGMKDRFAVCIDLTGDKRALQNRLDRVKDLLIGMKDGENKIKGVNVEGEKTIPQTAPQGQATLQQEMDSLIQDWETLINKMCDTQENIVHATHALENYDGTCESLNKWLREVEGQIRDYEMKATLNEKQTQVQKFKSLQGHIIDRQVAFDELIKMALEVQGADSRLANYSAQLNNRYEALKNVIKEVIDRWEEYVSEHQAYQAQHTACIDWIDTLTKRLHVCGDLAGDKEDVKDRLQKLQELMMEKDEGVSRLHQTVEYGERLYPNTATDGRDIIRQELRSLREQWEVVCDLIIETQHRLEACLLQWSSYDENYERLQKWLMDAEVKLKEDENLKTTLPDKRAQLQKHKVLHQEILSKQHVIDQLSDKAQSLTQSTPSAKVNKFVAELHSKYDKVTHESKVMLDRYEAALRDHQLFQEAQQDCADWIIAAKEKALMCSDTSGDRVSLQNKLERLKEFGTVSADVRKKMAVVQTLCVQAGQMTSLPGQEILKREVTDLESSWSEYDSGIESSRSELERALNQWGDFDAKFEACVQWLKNTELKVKDFGLKSSLPEKQEQVEIFKKQRAEILAHQGEIDRFSDDAQGLMHTSSDLRLGSHISQLTNRYQGLLLLIKELIGKWEKYAQEHIAYEERRENMNAWLSSAELKLEACRQPATDQDSMEDRRVLIQMLLAEKDQGLQKLNSMIEAGERLYPDTAATGREKIRQELRTAKDDWDSLFSSLNDTQRKVETFLHQWSSYSESQDQLMRWITETEGNLRADVELKNTLPEKRVQLQSYRTVLQDVLSHQRLVDSVVEKAQGVLKVTSNPSVAAFITDINSRYENLATKTKSMIQKCEQQVQEQQLYQDALQVIQDWMSLVKDRLSMCSDPSGDKHALQNKLDRLKELISTIPEGEAKLRSCEQAAESAAISTAPKGRQTIQQELDMVHMDWEDFNDRVGALHNTLQQAVVHWSSHDENLDHLSQWLKDAEREVKHFPLKSTLQEKRDQMQKYQDVMLDIKGHQKEVDHFSDEAQNLQQLTGESRVSASTAQLTSRYQALQGAVKEILKKCDQNVLDHKYYLDKHQDFSGWLTQAKEKFSTSTDTSGTRTQLEARLEGVQDLMQERDMGFAKLNQVIEVGEKLYPNTAPEGRDAVRQEMRALKLGWDSLFDDLSAVQRKLEVAMVQWTSFDDSNTQVAQWLKEMEGQLEGTMSLRATLEQKKSQLQNYKVLHQDVLSYQRVIDSVSDKAQTLVSSNSDPNLAKFVNDTGTRYQKLCVTAKERVQQYEKFVSEHQQYNDSYNHCVEWLNAIREKLSACADVTGDRHAIQHRLDKIQDILATKMEGEPKVKNVLQLAERVLPSTVPQGKEIVVRETDALRSDWEAFVTALTKTKYELESCMDQWKEFDRWSDKCSTWLKVVEGKVRDTEQRGSLQDKKAQLQKLIALQDELAAGQTDMDALSDSAQELVRISGDTRVVNQAGQLAAKYQTLVINVRELCRRWTQYVADHETYQVSYDDCAAWLNGVRGNLAKVADTSGSRQNIQGRLTSIQDVSTDKDEGLHKLQVALDNLQVVLPNTSVSGRDALRRETQIIQANYDGLSSELSGTKNRLESCLNQWTNYDASILQLQRWLTDLETQVKVESELQNTLQEKKLQLDRVKVLQLNAGSQRSTIDNLKEKAKSLKDTTSDSQLTEDTQIVVDRYDKLLADVKDAIKACDKHLGEHQVYKDAYMEATDWLSSSVDKLTACSDVRGARDSVEVQLSKVEDICGTLDVGRDKLDNMQGKGEAVLLGTSKQGQELIYEECRMLTNDFDSFESDLQELKLMLENLCDQWQDYDDYYDRLNHWIKTMESSLKAASDRKANLEQKTVQLEKQTHTHEEILGQQTAFDGLTERAQILLQTTTDSRVTAQLAQMSTRYSTLIAASKDHLKRFDQQLQDHQQYSEAHTEAKAWLDATKDKLSVFADTTGDKYTIQTQLEKLQEFVVIKEEGQLLIHTANTWGEKTMTNTSIEGREVIRQELHRLQHDWDGVISEVTDTKVALQSCLLQWTDFSDSSGQIQKWLKDMEKRVRDNEDKADLNEKKSELQRIKGLHQDIMAYEPVVESVDAKAQDLLLRSPASKATADTSTIVGRYQTLKEAAMTLLQKNDTRVGQHQEFQDLCDGFTSWLRDAREQLSSCSDTFGDKEAIITKIEKAQNLSNNLSDGSKKLAQATTLGEATQPSSSTAGQTKIRQDLQELKQDYEEFCGQVRKAQGDLDDCLDRWNEFEAVYQQFSNWLIDTENYLQADLEVKATVEEKKEHLDAYQNYNDEILARQSDLDKVSAKAQRLLQVNADAGTSHAITQLTTKYQGVITMSKDIVKNLDAYYSNHVTYKERLREFSDWLEDTKAKLLILQDTVGNKDDVSSKLGQILQLQASIDQGHGKMKSLLDSAEKTLPNTSPRGAQVVKQETDAMQKEYEALLTSLSVGKQNLEGALSSWGDYDQSYEQIHDWISDLESKLQPDPELNADLSAKKSNLEKYKALQQDLLASEDFIVRMEEKCQQLNDPKATAQIQDIKKRYAALQTTGEESVAQLGDQVESHEGYKASYTKCQDWLAGSKSLLNRLGDYSGDRETLQERLKALKTFRSEMGNGQDLISTAAKEADNMCLTTAPRGQDLVHQEIQAVRDDWKTFNMAVNEVENSLETCISNWKEFEELYANSSEWMDTTNACIKTALEPKADLALKQQQLRDAEDIYDEIGEQKTSLERVKEAGDAVSRKCSDPQVANKVMKLCNNYQALVASGKKMVEKCGENVKDHRAYDVGYSGAAEWLAVTGQQLQACTDTSGDWEAINDRLKSVKEISANLEEGLQKVNKVCDAAEKILPSSSNDGKKAIESQVTKMTNEWDRVNTAVADCAGLLENVQQRWYDYEEYCGTLTKWLGETEDILRADPEPKAQTTEKKTQLDKYKLLLSDIDNHQALVNDVAERVSNLEAVADNPDVMDSLADVQSRYDRVRTRCQDTVEYLERAYKEHQEFSEAHQDGEKWLLQTSFKLMAHNAMNVNSIETAQEQIEKHRVLLREIEDFRGTLDGVSQRARRMMENNSRVPQLVQQVQNQSENLEESYNNLQVTALQIKDRLNEVLNKWENYKGQLVNADQYLVEDFPQMMVASEAIMPDNLEDAQRQLEITRNSLEKLTSIRQDLSSAARRCENIGSSELLDRVDGDTPISQLSSRVTECMDDSVGQVEKRLEQIHDIINQWETVNRTKSDLRNWLHNKQEEVQQLEQRPTKLHAEAAEIEIDKIKAIRDEVRARGPAIEELLSSYRTLTQHNPSLADPVFRAVQDDWEELLGQIENLQAHREHALQASQEFRADQEDMEEDLQNYAAELERIEQCEATVVDRSLAMQPLQRKRSQPTNRSASSRPPSARDRHLQSGSDFNDSNDDNDEDNGAFSLQLGHIRRNGLSSQPSSIAGSRRLLPTPRSPFDRRVSGRSSNPDPKKSVEAGMESESEESGYGDTYTQRSIDTTLDQLDSENDEASNSNFYDTLQIPTPRSDSSVFYSDSESRRLGQRDAVTQTSLRSLPPLSMNTSYENDQSMSFASLRSMTPRSATPSTTRSRSMSKSEMLRSILSDVKSLKDSDTSSSPVPSESGTLNSENGVRREMMNVLLDDKLSDDEPQTSPLSRMIPDGASIHQTRQERLKSMLDELKGAGAENNGARSPGNSTVGSLFISPDKSHHSASASNRATPARFDMSRPATSTNTPFPETATDMNSPGFERYLQPTRQLSSVATPSSFDRPPITPLPTGQRRVTSEALDNITKRLDRLRNNRVPEASLRTTLPSMAECEERAREPAEFNQQISAPTVENVPQPTENSIPQEPIAYAPVYEAAPPVNYAPHVQFVAEPQYSHPIPLAHYEPPQGYVAAQSGAPMYSPIHQGQAPIYSLPAVQPRYRPRGRHPQRVRMLRRSYDDMDMYLDSDQEYGSTRFSRRHRDPNMGNMHRVIDRYNLDLALNQASETARHLKNLSGKMINSLRDEIIKG